MRNVQYIFEIRKQSFFSTSSIGMIVPLSIKIRPPKAQLLESYRTFVIQKVMESGHFCNPPSPPKLGLTQLLIDRKS